MSSLAHGHLDVEMIDNPANDAAPRRTVATLITPGESSL
jgi:hypothetical protein